MVTVNTLAMSGPAISARRQQIAERDIALKNVLRPGSLVAVLTNQDELYQLNTHSPTELMSVAQASATWWDIVEPLNDRAPDWRSDLGRRTMRVWNAGGDCWVSKRVWASRPRPEWHWAEGDDPRVSWKHLYPFFNDLDVDQQIGDDDGFFRLAQTQKNTRLLQPETP
jgi:hypothetical protein